jgi:hypothetical protein
MACSSWQIHQFNPDALKTIFTLSLSRISSLKHGLGSQTVAPLVRDALELFSWTLDARLLSFVF